MNDVMKFELLPNEILIECFDYLNAPDIFYSFDQLNFRFNNLIRTILLRINFQSIRKSIFDQFCTTMLLNPEIQNQIYSLQLSNKKTCGQIEAFLALFSFDQFSHLQSLSLIQIEKNNVESLELMLPFISKLRYFRMIDFHSDAEDLLDTLPISQLKTLYLSNPILSLPRIHRISSIQNLTLSYCLLNALLELLQYMPMLNYLDIRLFVEYVTAEDEFDDSCFTEYHATQLKTLIIRDIGGGLTPFEIFTRLLLPNLKMLVITTVIKDCIIDAERWEQLITSSLPHLTVFKFKFNCSYKGENDDILDKFQKFQTDFWNKQHHWYTEYTLSKYSASIYTIPYLLDTYTLTPYTCKYTHKSRDNSSIYDNVRELVLYQKAKRDCPYYFSNVTSLILDNNLRFEDAENNFIKSKSIKRLNKMVNLSNVKHLTISPSCQIQSTSVLLKLLKPMKQLSSLAIDSTLISFIFNDYELCSYVRNTIKKLDISQPYGAQCLNSERTEQLSEVFSNVEQLKCDVENVDQILILLTKLTKLSSIRCLINYVRAGENPVYSWLIDQQSQLTFIFKINDYNLEIPRSGEEICIWLDRK